MPNNKTIRVSDKVSVDVADLRRLNDGSVVVNGRISRVGIQEYAAYELGLDGDPMRIVKVYRPPEEVFAKESLASFDGIPITIGHPGEDVTITNAYKYAKGATSNITRDNNHVKVTMTIGQKDAVDAMLGGTKELSAGYRFRADMTRGKDENGIEYDLVQRDIRGNHVALVDSARCGSTCRVGDGDSTKRKTKMPDEKEANVCKVVVDGIPVMVTDVGAAAISKLAAENERLVQAVRDYEKPVKVGDQEYTRDALAKLAADQAIKIAALEKQVMTPQARDAMIADWVKLIDTSKRIAPGIVTDGKTCAAIRKEIVDDACSKNEQVKAAVDAVLSGKPLDAADDAVLRAAFGVVSAIKMSTASAAGATGAQDQGLATAMLGIDSASQTAQKYVGRNAMLARHSGIAVNRDTQTK